MARWVPLPSRLAKQSGMTPRSNGGPITLQSFFFNARATTEISPLSLHDALPIYICGISPKRDIMSLWLSYGCPVGSSLAHRSEEHTSELQSLRHLVFRLLLQ